VSAFLPRGRHLLADFHGVAAGRLGDAAAIEALLRAAADAAGATPVAGHFHPFGPGLGVTGVLLLQESHISIHTWPEHGFAAVDVFMCGAPGPTRPSRPSPPRSPPGRWRCARSPGAELD
jgi:S-adenosylmethionine decarboxylase